MTFSHGQKPEAQPTCLDSHRPVQLPLWPPPALDALSNAHSPTALPATGLTPGVNLLLGDSMGTPSRSVLCSSQCMCHHPALARGSLQQRNLHQGLCSHSCPWSPPGSATVPRSRSVTSPSLLLGCRRHAVSGTTHLQTHLQRATWGQGTAGLDCPTLLGTGLCQPGLCHGGAGSCPCPARGVSSTSLCIAAASCLRRATATAWPPQRAETPLQQHGSRSCLEAEESRVRAQRRAG